MKSPKNIIRTAVALALLGTGVQAIAGPVVVQPLTGVATALSTGGSVMSYTSGVAACPNSLFPGTDCCGNSPSTQYTLKYGSTTLGSVLQVGGNSTTAGSGLLFNYNPSTNTGVASSLLIVANGNPNSPTAGTYTFTPGVQGTGVSTAPNYYGSAAGSFLPSMVGATTSGVVAANNFNVTYATNASYGTSSTVSGVGAIYTPGAGTRYVDGTITGISQTTGAVAFTQQVLTGGGTGVTQQSYFLGSGSNSPVTISNLGYGSVSSGVNDSGAVTGGAFLGNNTAYGFPDNTLANEPTEAFKTGANGSGITYLGLDGGNGTFGNAINNSGQVGGYVDFGGGFTEAFITTAFGGLSTGVGDASLGSDSTQMVYLNNSGNGILEDTTTGDYYYYTGGVLASISSLDGGVTPANDKVVGFDNANQILLQDPDLVTINASQDTAGALLASGAGEEITGGLSYLELAYAEGYAPTASFFEDPTASTDSNDFTAFTFDPNTGAFPDPVAQAIAAEGAGGGSGSAAVPEPGMLSLAGFGALLLGRLRRKAKSEKFEGVAA